MKNVEMASLFKILEKASVLEEKLKHHTKVKQQTMSTNQTTD